VKKVQQTHASLVQENGFGSASLHWLQWLVKAKNSRPVRMQKRV
jgi:hypothetical protein